MPPSLQIPTRSFVAGLPWPLPALLTWACAWAAWGLASAWAAAPALALGAGLLAGSALATRIVGRRRQFIAAAGFPLSALALGAASLSPWMWLALALPLLLAYPLRAWRDAPFFPTPRQGLTGLAASLGGAPARVLDAGCGLGHGLAELRDQWPLAELHGLEWSRPLAWLAARRCRYARVRRGDMWAASWTGYDLVYLFQRPESMARAYAKAARELAPGAWLVSLEFAVADREAWACLQGPGRRPLWIYRPAQAAPPSIDGRHGR
ncbi:MAG: class I SAM-dependent methyltransferase [Rubrivivax sp.]|nr:class I SAM-dependent methyltransferase [Rubrivivax sp.]